MAPVARPGDLWRRLAPILLLILLAVGAMLGGFILGSRPEPPPERLLQVTVINVGYGESTLLRTPEDQVILIGGGPREAGPRVVQSLKAAGVQRIDLLVLPYRLEEAIGGLRDVIREFPIGLAVESGSPGGDEIEREILDMLDARGIPVQMARAGERIEDGHVQIEILHPSEPLLEEPPVAANNSLALRVVFGQTAFLYAGGMSSAGEVALLSRMPDLTADWLRVAHFGSRDATSSELLRLVGPEVAVISVGPGSAEGHPHRETLERLDAAGTQVYRTDQLSGDLHFQSNGTNIVIR